MIWENHVIYVTQYNLSTCITLPHVWSVLRVWMSQLIPLSRSWDSWQNSPLILWTFFIEYCSGYLACSWTLREVMFRELIAGNYWSNTPKSFGLLVASWPPNVLKICVFDSQPSYPKIESYKLACMSFWIKIVFVHVARVHQRFLDLW